MNSGSYGENVARHFRLREAPSVAIGGADAVGIAVTRLRSEKPLDDFSTVLPREKAYSIALHIENSADQELWLRGKRVFSGPYQSGSVSIVDLQDEPVARIGNPYDFLQIYLPRTAIDDVAIDHGAPPINELTWPRGTVDQTMLALGRLLLPSLDGVASNRLFVDHVLLALRVHVAQAYGGVTAARLKLGGGLAAWQERRAKDIVRTRFAEPLSIADLARECGLSPSHFTRAFRQSTGVQPHRWLSHVRVDTAKHLLLQGDLPLAEIALACGFGDQSYFTRMFTRAVGLSPGAWQRRCRV